MLKKVRLAFISFLLLKIQIQLYVKVIGNSIFKFHVSMKCNYSSQTH